MNKLFSLQLWITISFILVFILNPSNVFAVDTCAQSGIDFSPKYFPEGQSSIDLSFQINNSNILDNIRGCEARLNFGTGIIPGQTSLSVPTNIPTDGNNFSLSLTDETLRTRGEHWGRLELRNSASSGSSCRVNPTDTFQEFCTDVKYQVGARNKCRIDQNLERKIPPNTQLTVKFFGNANTDYRISTGRGDTIRTNILGQTRTQADGQGRFNNILIPGLNGDTTTITIWDPNAAIEAYCEKNIEISAAAPPPKPPSDEPVLPEADGTKKCQPAKDAREAEELKRSGISVCASSAGDPCGNDPTNPGINTAIGCIHTQPAGLVKDILKFIIAISGGIALMLMIIGAFGMITSAGNPDNLAASRDRFVKAIEGLLFVIFAVLLLRIIGVDILGLGQFFGMPTS